MLSTGACCLSLPAQSDCTGCVYAHHIVPVPLGAQLQHASCLVSRYLHVLGIALETFITVKVVSPADAEEWFDGDTPCRAHSA